MKRKIAWLGLSFLIVAALVLASCGPTGSEEEEVEVPILSIGETYQAAKVEVTVLEASVTDSYEYYDKASDSMLSKEASPGMSFHIVTIKIDNVYTRPLVNEGQERFLVTDSENNTYLYQEYLGENPLVFPYIMDREGREGNALFNIPEGASGLKIAYTALGDPDTILVEWGIE